MAPTTQIATHAELVACFRRIDRKDVELADDLRFPLRIAPVATWSYGSRSFLVLRDGEDGAPLGIVFRRTAVAATRGTGMCAWCQRVRARNDVQLLSARVSARRTIGQYLCRDLSCFRVEDVGPYEQPDGAVIRVERALVRMHMLVDERLRR